MVYTVFTYILQVHFAGTCYHFLHRGWDLARRCRTLAKSIAKVEKLKAKNAWQRKIQETQVPVAAPR